MGDGQVLFCVEFRVPVNPRLTNFEQSIRNRVLTELADRDLGVLVGTGAGQGWIGYTFRVQDADTARRLVDEVMARVMPNQQYKATEMGENSVCPTTR